MLSRSFGMFSLVICCSLILSVFLFQGLAITFVSDEVDAKVLNNVQERFDVSITDLPEEIDLSSYSKFFVFYCVVLSFFNPIL